MKIWAVVGISTDYDEDEWIYAVCISEELADRELKTATETESEDWTWRIEELKLITE